MSQSRFTVQHCNVAVAPAANFRPDLNQTQQLRTVARLRMQQRKNIALQAHGHNTLHEGKQAGSIQSYETATKWSNLALITEASRYHRDLSAKTGEYRTFLPPTPGVECQVFGSTAMLKLMIDDAHLLFSYAQDQAAIRANALADFALESTLSQHSNNDNNNQQQKSRSVLSLVPSAERIKAIETADSMCRQQLGLLHQWRRPSPDNTQMMMMV